MYGAVEVGVVAELGNLDLRHGDAGKKALIARDLWEMSEYFQVVNEMNHSVQKAIELLSEPGMNFPRRE